MKRSSTSVPVTAGSPTVLRRDRATGDLLIDMGGDDEGPPERLERPRRRGWGSAATVAGRLEQPGRVASRRKSLEEEEAPMPRGLRQLVTAGSSLVNGIHLARVTSSAEDSAHQPRLMDEALLEMARHDAYGSFGL